MATTTNTEITFRPATPADKEGILELFKAAFAKSEVTEKPRDLWEWQMQHNPDGEPFTGLAICDRVIVGNYTVIPYNYKNEKGETVKVGLVVDVMVHPGYQGRKIFVNLGKYTLPEAVKKLGIAFTFGYPFTGTTYDSVIPGHTKVGWKLTDRLYFYMAPIRTRRIIEHKFPGLKPVAGIAGFCFDLLYSCFALALRCAHPKNDRSLTVQAGDLQGFTDSDLALINRYSKNRFMKIRNREFLEWRFLRKPDTQYKIIRLINEKNETAGFEILNLFTLGAVKTGVIVDIIAEKENMVRLMHAGNAFCKKNGCDGIFFIDYRHSDIAGARNRCGFINTREYYQIINWPGDNTVQLPEQPRVNFMDFDIF